MEAAGEFSSVMPYTPAWTSAIETTAPDRFLVAVAVRAHGTQVCRHGAGDSEVEAAARATLHALDRVLSLELRGAGCDHRSPGRRSPRSPALVAQGPSWGRG
jgi:hypothetical protein